MRKIIITALIFSAVILFPVSAQQSVSSEKYGNTLNLGLGIGGYSGYYGYTNHTLPVFHANYELGVARNFTLAPFVTLYSYRGDNYRETVTPLGVKASYYFDNLLGAGQKWDFYLAGSLGFALVSTMWDSGYQGDRTYYQKASPLFLDLHVGTEYHITNRIGAFLDISSGVSSIGIAIH